MKVVLMLIRCYAVKNFNVFNLIMLIDRKMNKLLIFWYCDNFSDFLPKLFSYLALTLLFLYFRYALNLFNYYLSRRIGKIDCDVRSNNKMYFDDTCVRLFPFLITNTLRIYTIRTESKNSIII